MRIRKVLSLLLALVFAVSLVSVLPVSAGAAEKLDTPEGRWDGTTIEWNAVPNAARYSVILLSDPDDGIHVSSIIMDVLVEPQNDGTLDMTLRDGKNPKGSAWDGHDLFSLDVSNLIVVPSDKYYFSVRAFNNASGYETSDAFTSEHVFGSILKAVPHTVTVTNGTADPSEARAGEKVTITYKASNVFTGLLSTFDHWEVTSGGVTLANASAKTTTFTMPDRDVSIKAVTKSKTHTISVVNGFADPSEAVAGQTVTITYQLGGTLGLSSVFDHWTVNSGGVTLADANSATTTFTMPDQDVSVTAAYRPREEHQVPLAFTTQPKSGTAKKADGYPCSWTTNETPDTTYLDMWFTPSNDWGGSVNVTGHTSWSITYNSAFVDGNVSKYRIRATKGSETVQSTEFTVTWTEDAGEQNNPFVDIKKSDLWYDAVLWAFHAKPQVTNGVDATHFGPEKTVTRGQCAAFLWRAMGEPEPTNTKNPFVDVPASQYYYKPILWAVEKGITKGTDDTHFSPNSTLSTKHIITFLYRAKNPGMDGWGDGKAETWAGQGYGGKPFGVDINVSNTTDCPRGYVVMFLQKAK